MVSVAGSTRPSCVRVRRSAPNERGGRSLGLEHLVSRRSLPGICCTHGRVRDLAGFLATHPTPLPCSKTPAEPTRPRLWRSCRHRPRPTQTEGLSGYIISRLTQGFSIRCLRFTSDVAVSHARLASGWRAAPLPGGGRTLWIASKGFRLHYHSPFQDLSCRKGSLCRKSCGPELRCGWHPNSTPGPLRGCFRPARRAGRRPFAYRRDARRRSAPFSSEPGSAAPRWAEYRDFRLARSRGRTNTRLCPGRGRAVIRPLAAVGAAGRDARLISPVGVVFL
jgi:hypothetical protein